MSVAVEAPDAGALTPSQRLLLSAIGAELARQDPSGAATEHVDDIQAAARAAVDALVDTGAFWEEHLGPVYDAKTVAVILGSPDKPVSRQAVSKRPLLALRTGNGRVYYPAPFMTNDNLEYYEDAYEIGYEKVIDTYAAATQHVDQGLSLTLFFKDTATTRDINKAQIYAWRKGIKTLYYIRLRQMALEGTEVEGCVSCML